MSSDPTLDVRRRRAQFRAGHRGIKEMDLILGRFADSHAGTMDANQLLAFEQMMEIDDQSLLKWFTGEVKVPADQDTPLFRAICAFHAIELN